MTHGRVVVTLLILNLGLVAGLIAMISGDGREAPAGRAPAPPELETRYETNRVYQTNWVSLPLARRFHWRELESADYRTYIENLKAIGCPIQTIRDIIIADLDLLWAPRLRGIVPRRETLRYWESEAAELANDYDEREWERAKKTIDREKRDVLRELLGFDFFAERFKQSGAVDPLERKLSFLDETKRMGVRDVVDRFREEEAALLESQWAEGRLLTQEERTRLERLRGERSAALNAVLLPEEREQYDLWMSSSAEAVRHDLYGMDATESEFRSVYDLQQAFDERWSKDLMDWEDPEEAGRWIEARAQLDGRIKAALGGERYAEYERGRDQDFHLLNNAISRYGLDRQHAKDVYAMKQVLQTERDRVILNEALTMEQKREVLGVMDQELHVAIKQTLGDNAYNYYRRQSDWAAINPWTQPPADPTMPSFPPGAGMFSGGF